MQKTAEWNSRIYYFRGFLDRDQNLEGALSVIPIHSSHFGESLSSASGGKRGGPSLDPHGAYDWLCGQSLRRDHDQGCEQNAKNGSANFSVKIRDFSEETHFNLSLEQ